MLSETDKTHGGKSVGSAASASAPGNNLAVSVRGISKCYEIYRKPIDRLKQTLWHGRRQFFSEFWALRDVSLDVPRGQAIGIIGRNGSGKSTLLQIIAGTLRPTDGEVKVQGRVAALLELGSGFNPEFTGRENVYLNGAILGLASDEIDAKFDAIAAFADIGDFIDMPVKTYSTGMLVRLAFAVQAMIEPEILIIDESLAVGDAAFQIKCMSRMARLVEKGVSIILVTHDVNTVRTFCRQAIWLELGRVHEIGPPGEVTSRYLQFMLGGRFADAVSPQKPLSASKPEAHGNPQATLGVNENDYVLRALTSLEGRTDLIRWGNGDIRVTGLAIDNGEPGCAPAFEYGDRLHIEMDVRAMRDVPSETLGVAFAFRNTKGLDIITYTTWDAAVRLPPMAAGAGLRAVFEVDNILAAGEYALVLVVEDVHGHERRYLDFVENAIVFRVVADLQVFSAVLPEVRFRAMDANQEQ